MNSTGLGRCRKVCGGSGEVRGLDSPYLLTSLPPYFHLKRSLICHLNALSQSSSPTRLAEDSKAKSSPGFTKPVSKSSPSNPCASPKKKPAASTPCTKSAPSSLSSP